MAALDHLHPNTTQVPPSELDPTAGVFTSPTPVYFDVQCESAHGPGFDHVPVPDGGTGPLASIIGRHAQPRRLRHLSFG